MPILFILSLALQAMCVYHVVKTGQDKYWVYLILMAPGIGCLVYGVAVMLPSMKHSREGQQAIRTLQNKIDPTRHIRALEDGLTLRDTPELRTNLADEYVAIHDHNNAITQYKKALIGPNESNPDTLLKLAHAYFNTEQFNECLQTLMTLLERNPSFVSQEGHLLQAKALEKQGDVEGADEAYRQVTDYYSGPQAHLSYAQFLHANRRNADAKAQLDEILSYARIAPPHYKRFHKKCLADAKKLLDSIP